MWLKLGYARYLLFVLEIYDLRSKTEFCARFFEFALENYILRSFVHLMVTIYFLKADHDLRLSSIDSSANTLLCFKLL